MPANEFDNQLDLFAQPESFVDDEKSPKEKKEAVPCPHCTDPKNWVPYGDCQLCKGTLLVKTGLIQVEGYWLDKASEMVIAASSFEEACRKLRVAEYPLLETNFDDRLEPYYVGHGGYTEGDWD